MRIRWRYLPRAAPWLMRFVGMAAGGEGQGCRRRAARLARAGVRALTNR